MPGMIAVNVQFLHLKQWPKGVDENAMQPFVQASIGFNPVGPRCRLNTSG